MIGTFCDSLNPEKYYEADLILYSIAKNERDRSVCMKIFKLSKFD